ncbi:hypothetical protein ANCDUO_17523, partial [Ancylostoma duodenale]
EEASSEQEENGEKDEENQSCEEKEVEVLAESRIEESPAVKKTECDGWEDVGGEIVKKTDVKAETGNPFRENSPFGGFSRTNAAIYYQEEQNKKSERHNRRRSHEQNHVISSSGSGSSVAEQSGDGPRVGWNNTERTDLNMIDEQYVEYYEYLCQGIQKLLESGITLNADCESRGSTTSFQQPTVCRALKSKYYRQYNLGPEIYSRKVFVGGLPIDIEEDELVETFARFGPLVVDWPNKNDTKSYYPPKGYVFLIFNHETSVRTLVQHCTIEDEKLFLFISSPMNTEKLKVQIRPWRLADADYLVDVNVPINLRRVVFVGGVPRPIRAGLNM